MKTIHEKHFPIITKDYFDKIEKIQKDFNKISNHNFLSGLVSYFNCDYITRSHVFEFLIENDKNDKIKNYFKTSDKWFKENNQKVRSWQWRVGGILNQGTWRNKNSYTHVGNTNQTHSGQNNAIYKMSEPFHNNIHLILMEYFETGEFNLNRIEKIKDIEKYNIFQIDNSFIFTTDKLDVISFTEIPMESIYKEVKFTNYFNHFRREEFIKNINKCIGRSIDNDNIEYQKSYGKFGRPDFIEINNRFNRPIELQLGLLDNRHIDNIINKYQNIGDVKETIMIAENFDNIVHNMKNVILIKMSLYINKNKEYRLLFTKN